VDGGIEGLTLEASGHCWRRMFIFRLEDGIGLQVLYLRFPWFLATGFGGAVPSGLVDNGLENRGGL
jgi:hypothetical protein